MQNNDSVTDIKATTDLGNISFEQHQESHQAHCQAPMHNEAHYKKEVDYEMQDQGKNRPPKR